MSREILDPEEEPVISSLPSMWRLPLPPDLHTFRHTKSICPCAHTYIHTYIHKKYEGMYYQIILHHSYHNMPFHLLRATLTVIDYPAQILARLHCTALTGHLTHTLSHTALTGHLTHTLSHTALMGHLTHTLSHTALAGHLTHTLSHTALAGHLTHTLSHTALTGHLTHTLSHTCTCAGNMLPIATHYSMGLYTGSSPWLWGWGGDSLERAEYHE